MATEAPAALSAAAAPHARRDGDEDADADADKAASTLDELLAYCSDSEDGEAGADAVAPVVVTPETETQSPESNHESSSQQSVAALDATELSAVTAPIWALEETRAGVHTPPPLPPPELPLDVGDVDFLDGSGAENSLDHSQLLYDTDDMSSKSSESSFQTGAVAEQSEQVQQVQTQREVRLGKRRRQRQRQRDELKHLGYHVEELKMQLERLQTCQREFSRQTLVAASKLSLPLQVGSANGLAAGEVWSQVVNLEREQLRTSIMENTRLRAQYECQLQIANGLKRLYENQDSFSILDSSPDSGFLAKKPRTDTISDDSTIFASLSRDFDAQYAQTDAVLAAAKLTNFDGELVDEMLLRKNEHGVFYFDNLYSKVFPFEVETVRQVLWQCLSVEQLQNFHSSYQVLKCTDDTAHTKVINTVTLPGAETTLVVHIATRKFQEEHRSVCVWEGIIEAQGAVSMRLRETGWNVLRPAHALRPGQRGPVSIEQACVRITPEVQTSSSEYTEKNFAVGTLTNLLIGSYHRRMEQVHFVADDLLATQFENVSLGE